MVSKLHAGRAVLIGDAAHAVSASLGQVLPFTLYEHVAVGIVGKVFDSGSLLMPCGRN
jgi:hypothetical protein